MITKTCTICNSPLIRYKHRWTYCGSVCHVLAKQEADLIRCLRKYGMTYLEYKYLLADQYHVCAICGNPETQKLHGRPKRLAIDHCHKTNRVRGLLCQRCNTGLGHFKDDLVLLNVATQYLQRNPAQ